MFTQHPNVRCNLAQDGRTACCSYRVLLAILACLVFLLSSPQGALSQSEEIVGVGTGSPTPPASADKYPLTGTVVDAVSGEPIRKALVEVYTNQRRMTFSDGDGRFQLEGIPAGSYSVVAQKPGYFNQQELLRGGAPPGEVGPKAPPPILKLSPEAVLTGKVTTTAGVPLEHVPLNLEYIEIREGRRRWASKGSAIPDEGGR